MAARGKPFVAARGEWNRTIRRGKAYSAKALHINLAKALHILSPNSNNRWSPSSRDRLKKCRATLLNKGTKGKPF